VKPAGALLEIDDLHVTIQSMEALRGFSLRIAPREMAGLIGRNGAGKTTLMRTIMGHLPPVRGAIRFAGEDLSVVARHARAARGVGYMPEDRQLVPELTVEENILLPTWVTRTLDGPERLAFVYEIMPEVAEMRGRKALLLSGGQQKLVALCRALAAGTRLLLLDEPFEGVAPALSQRLSEVIAGLKGTDLAVLITQSELNHSRMLFDHEYVIERGVAGEARSAA
jgi:branched-chain amino acid transport system ATP-binding protein